MKKSLKRFMCTFLVVALLVPGLSVSAQKTDGELMAENRNQAPKSTVSVVGGNSANVTKAPAATTSGFTSKRVPYSTVKTTLEKYQAKSKDVKGWLLFPDSNMSMPIVLGPDNVHYINRTWDGVHYPNNNWRNFVETATYLDHRVTLGKAWNKSSRNIVIYGHNWTNLKEPYDIGNYPQHTMFAQLGSYNDLAYSQTHPYVYFSTDDMEGVWKVFAVAYTETAPTNFSYNTPNIRAKNMDAVVKEWKQRSLFNFDVDVNGNDQFLTLTTCTRHYPGIIDGQRFSVVARRLRPGETDTDPVKVTLNTNKKEPMFG